MSRFPIGIIALIVVSVLIYFGLAHRILDRMRLSDRTALFVLGGMILGSFVDIPLASGRVNASINVGGGLVPLGLAGYVLSRAGTAKELIRTLAAAAVTGILIYLIGTYIMQGDPGTVVEIIDPMWLYPVIAGLVAYLAGRSRRSAFIAATTGLILLDVFNWIYLAYTKTPGRVSIGGAGAFDSIILAGLIAVLLAEIIGETRERLQGGPESEGRPSELLAHLKNDNYAPGIQSDTAKEHGKAGEHKDGEKNE